MIKKLSMLLLVLLLGLNLSVSAADDLDYEEGLELLKGLGIADKMSYSVKVGDYVGFLGGMLYGETAYDVQTIAKMSEMISEGEYIEADKRINYAEAVKYSVIALGYKVQAEASGDYFVVADKLGITDGIVLEHDSWLTPVEAVQLLVNMLEAEPMKKSVGKNGVEYKVITDETILSLNRNIRKIKGVVTAGSITGLTREKGAGEGYIEIDGVIYEADRNFDSLLGKNVCAYIEETDNGEYKAIHMYGYRNEELEISSELLDGASEEYITYFEESNKEKLKKAKLSPTLRVIYNGVFLGKYEPEELLTKNGKITLTDNNRDSEYDVVMIKEYETLVVSGIILENEKLVNKFRFENALKTISLEIDNKDNYVSIYESDGTEIEFSDIKINDILSIAKSKSTEPAVIEIYRNNQMIEGMLGGCDETEKIITVNQSEYKYLDELYKQLESEQKKFEIGKTYRFYIDSFNNIVYSGFVNDSDYYVFYRSYEEDEEYYISYMDIDEMWKVSKLAKKTTLNGTKLSKNLVYNEIQYYNPQVVELLFNSAGDIKEINFAEVSAVADETKFIKSPNKQLMYRGTPKSFSGSIWLENSAKVFVFPKDTKDKEKYAVYEASGYFRSDRTYKFTVYDMDEYGFTPLLSVNESDNNVVSYSSSYFLVTETFKTVIDDEVLSCVIGVCGDFVKYQLIGDNDTRFEGIKPGDIIKVRNARNGRIDDVSKVVSTDTDNFPKISESELYHNDAMVAGEVIKLDAANERIMIDCGTVQSFRLQAGVPVIIYDRSSKTCEQGTTESLIAGDKVVCRVPYIRFSEIIIVRE